MSKNLDWLPHKLDMEFDLLNENLPEISSGGAYILCANNTFFPYPWGKSKVYYIGQCRDLKRLYEHRKFVLRAKVETDKYWWPRYGYASAFGAKILWFSAHRGQSPRSLEIQLVDVFYWRFGAIPVANCTWPGE